MKNTSSALPERDIISSVLEQAGFSAVSQQPQHDLEPMLCRYICNKDGSIRWIWPAKNHQPDILRFYHAKGWRGVLFSSVIRLFFLLRSGRFIASGAFTLYVEPRDVKNMCRWSLFTGTVGPNRKVLVWKKDKHGNPIYCKIAYSPKAQFNIQREASALQLLATSNKTGIVPPAVLAASDKALMITDIGSGVTKTNDIRHLPFTALSNWSTPHATKTLLSIPFFENISHEIVKKRYMQDERVPPAFMNKVKQLHAQINIAAKVPVSYAHGDFTPWNVWYKNNSLHVVDLELFREQMPALYDVFHFVYQSNILIGHNSYATIRQQLESLLNQPGWKAFISQHAIDVALMEQLYLLDNIMYYLDIYMRQQVWHEQVNWLLQTWNEAITHHLTTVYDQRKFVLNDLSILLHTVPYAVLKFQEQHFADVSVYSDIDICIAKKDTHLLVQQIQRHRFVHAVQVRAYSYMHRITIKLQNGQLIYLDAIHAIKRKSLCFMDVKQIIRNAQQNAYGIKLASIEDDWQYTSLFYTLNGSPVPQRYITHFMEKANQQLLPPVDANNVHDTKVNKGLQALYNRWLYAMDTIKKLFTDNGFIITFSGVDGAGKSTVIDNIRLRVEKKYRKPVVVLRHRPSVLPILSAWKYGKEQAEARSVSTLPRQGSNKNTISSLFRFAYYYTDYLIGQLYIYARYVCRGYVVIYDRYYFDFINDARRSNISLPQTFTGWWYRFLLKPRYNFFLYATAEEILQRKKELDAITIEALTQQYQQLFHQLNERYRYSRYTSIYNHDLSITLDTIETAIK